MGTWESTEHSVWGQVVRQHEKGEQELVRKG